MDSILVLLWWYRVLGNLVDTVGRIVTYTHVRSRLSAKSPFSLQLYAISNMSTHGALKWLFSFVTLFSFENNYENQTLEPTGCYKHLLIYDLTFSFVCAYATYYFLKPSKVSVS